MRTGVIERIRSWVPTLMAVLVGLLLGIFLREWRPEKMTSFSGELHQLRSGRSGPAESSAAGVSAKILDRPRTESLTFSRLQWRTLQRRRGSLLIDLGDCLAWTRDVEIPVEGDPSWGIDGYSIRAEDGGPDLEPIAEFLGLDDQRVEHVRSALRRFGQSLGEVERRSAQASYTGDGTVRVTFGNDAISRREAFSQLDADLIEAIGPRDARRFSAATALISDQARTDQLDLGASVEGDYLRIGIAGYGETVVPKDSTIEIATFPPQFLKRVAHIGLEIDWKRLIDEARNQPTAK